MLSKSDSCTTRKDRQGRFNLHLPVSCLYCLAVVLFAASLGLFGSEALSVDNISSLPAGKNVAIDRAKFLSTSSAAWGTLLVPQAQSSDTKIDTNKPRCIEENLPMTYGRDKKGNPLSKGILVHRWTGDSTPFEFPVNPYKFTKKWPTDWPFRETDFFRSDGNDDAWFFEVPRLCYHMGEPAVASLTQYYRNNIPAKSDILDICSSWVSHYPQEFPKTMKTITGMGMNDLEMKYNNQLTAGYKIKDLNDDPNLPYPSHSFDVVTIAVSMNYLVQPVEILNEIRRVLRPGGKVIISQSNHSFPSKTIAMVSLLDYIPVMYS